MKTVDAPIVLAATIRVNPESANSVETALIRTAELVRSEPGCLGYEVNRVHKSPGVFMILEKWSDAENLRNHSEGLPLKNLLEEISTEMTTGLEVVKLIPLAKE